MLEIEKLYLLAKDGNGMARRDEKNIYQIKISPILKLSSQFESKRAKSRLT